VILLQDGDAAPEGAPYAAWMAYQKGQAAKTETVQAAAAAPVEALHARVAELEAELARKIAGFGESLDPIFAEIGKRLASLEAAPPVSPAPPAPTADAGGTNQPT
jgi:hypothetical protein